MRVAILTGLVMAVGLTASTALAQDASAGQLTLLCQGSEMTVTPSAGYGYGNVGGMREGRVPASLVVVVDNTSVRVKPPEIAIPVYVKRSKDGWYDLTETAVDKFSIRGKLRLSRIDRPKLNIDRRTGAATFGAFTGVCNRVAAATEATRF